MNAKSKLLFVIAIGLLSHQNPCNGMDFQEARKNHDDLMREAQQIKIPPGGRKILTDIRDEFEQRSIRSASSLRPIRERVDVLLEKEQVNPEEIDSVRRELEEVADQPDSEINQLEYENLKERLDIAYNYTAAIAELQKSNDAWLKRLDDNFNTVTDEGEKVTLWKDIFSGGLTVSFLANIVAIFGFMIKVPNAKLERQLKELLIIEKKAQLKQDGIDL